MIVVSFSRKLKELIFVIVLPLAGMLSAHADPDCTNKGFLPDNKLKIPVAASFTGMTEQQFNEILDKVGAYYLGVVNALGGTLIIDRRWQDETVNAYAERQGKQWIIHMYGGLARHSVVTADAFALVACHELGHHLGGAPKVAGQWAANEGEADYFATLKCLRNVWNGDDNRTVVSGINVDAEATRQCQQSFADVNEQFVCERGSMAGLSSAKLTQYLNNSSGNLSFTQKDPTTVSVTNDQHPKAQCRLDTYFAGAICQKSRNDSLSESDPTVGSCSVEKGDSVGVRPRCWYAPGPITGGGGGGGGGTGGGTGGGGTGGGTPTPPQPPPVDNRIAKTPTLNNVEKLTMNNPYKSFVVKYNVSEFWEADGIYLEVSQANQTFANPNDYQKDPGALYGKTFRWSVGSERIIPVDIVKDFGVYQIRILPLGAGGTFPVGHFSNPAELTLEPKSRAPASR